jgi:DNA replication and repair protein RecF
MAIFDIRLQKFRSYRDDSFEFDPSVNIIVGPNASGKTNLLEALLVSARGHSFRAKDPEMVAFGAPWSRLDTATPDGDRTVKLMVQDGGAVKKEFVIREKKLSRLTMRHTLPVVLFEPNHLSLLHGPPDGRRDYLDNLIEQLVPGYGKARRDYKRALAQRNALLKRGFAGQGQLFAWNIRLSETGAQLVRERSALVRDIDARLDELYKKLAHSKLSVGLRYQTQFDTGQYASGLLKGLEMRQETDIERGFTTVGPHRDDLVVTFDRREAALSASRGEIRTVLLALKIIELQFVEKVRGSKPILLLDDVFSELDGARRQALTAAIGGYQSFITTTDADVVVRHFMDNSRIIPL